MIEKGICKMIKKICNLLKSQNEVDFIRGLENTECLKSLESLRDIFRGDDDFSKAYISGVDECIRRIEQKGYRYKFSKPSKPSKSSKASKYSTYYPINEDIDMDVDEFLYFVYSCDEHGDDFKYKTIRDAFFRILKDLNFIEKLKFIKKYGIKWMFKGYTPIVGYYKDCNYVCTWIKK